MDADRPRTPPGGPAAACLVLHKDLHLEDVDLDAGASQAGVQRVHSSILPAYYRCQIVATTLQ